MRRVLAAAALGLGVVACGGASRSDVRQVSGILTVRPELVDFGDVALGKEETTTLTLMNDGVVDMAVEQLAPAGDGTFEVQGLPVTLRPGTQKQLSLRYRPAQLGSHQGKLELVTDSPKADHAEIGLRGHAVRGLATLSGDSFDFGDVVLNESASQNFSLVNNDGHAVTSIRVALPEGGDSAAFRVRPPGESPLRPEQSMQVEIDFQPNRLGDLSAVVQVTPCPTCSPRAVMLSGRGVEKLLDVQPASIDFGEVLLGRSASQSFTVRNTSKSPLQIKGLTLPGGIDATVALDGAGYPMTLAAGQTVSGTATFRPRNLGTQSATAAMIASDGGPGLLSVTGLGMGPVLQVQPKALYVGPAALGTTRSAFITVTNVGLDPKRTALLTIDNVSVLSADPAWTLESPTPVQVGEPGGSTQIRFSFTPQQPGMSQATLVLDSNDGLHPHVEVPLTALGRDLLPCQLNLSPGNPVDFGPVKLFTPSVQGFELFNATRDDCIVGDPQIISGAPAFRWPGGVAPAGRTLPPGGRMSVRVEFVAQSAQSYSGAVRFYVSNKSAPSSTIDLVGEGDASCFFVTPATVDFGPTTLGCGYPDKAAFAVNQCPYTVTVTQVGTSGAPFSANVAAPFTVATNSSVAIPVSYRPATPGDDVGTLRVTASTRAEPYRAGLTAGTQAAATILDQWDQSTPKVDLLIVIDNSGSMAEEQRALAANLDHLWNRIALANADYHIAVTSSGMTQYTSGWSQCPGGANGGEAGRFFPVDGSRPRLLTPQTPNVKQALFANTNVGQCHWDERFLDPVMAALTDPLISSTKAPGTPWPADGNAGFLRDDARLALLAVTDADDDADVPNPPPVSEYVKKLAAIKHGALDLVSFAGMVPLRACSTAEGIGTRFMEIARQLHGHLEDICNLDNMGTLLENSLGNLLLPLTSFPLSAHPKDPAAIQVSVNGAPVTNWSYEALANRIVFPNTAVPAPGSHITAKYEPACQ
jgi:hypothetical protein